MEVARWIRGLAPLAVFAVLAGSGLGRAPALGAAAPPWLPPPCEGTAGPAAPIPVPEAAAWFRMTAVLDRSGSLAGQRLAFGVTGGRPRVLELPPESFASGPVHGRVVVGDDDGATSRIRVVDAAHGCTIAEAAEADVIRSAALSPDGSSLVEHRVDRVTRVDLGVWVRSADLGPATRLLPGLPADDRYGPTFTTELRWAAGSLGVSSCGELACRGRVADLATGRVSSVEATGPMLGIHGTTVVAYDTCHGFPCPILAVDSVTGAREVLVVDAGPAALGGPGASTLVFSGSGGSLETLDLETRTRRPVADSRALLPVHDGSLATSGIGVPAGDVPVAPDGTVDDPGRASQVDPTTSAIEPARETTP